ncbi:MAG: LysE family translocator [Proteobacteria bacterium]|nr:LysE family translocator [Pseudomonadota bacterium]
MTWETWLLFAVTGGALCLSPGPDVLLVTSQGMAWGLGAAMRSAGGILGANAVYFALSATSLGAFLIASHDLFTAIKWLGAAYLVWLGLCTVLHPGASSGEKDRSAPARRAQIGGGFVRGFVLQAANPKSLLFFVALLPQLIDPAGDVVLQIVIFGLTSAVLEFFVLLGYGALAARAGRLARAPLGRLVDRTGGVLLIFAGAGLTLVRRA